jgi:hemerythrin-like domain-containing protein
MAGMACTMDAIRILKDDHKTVEQLFKRFEKAGDGSYVEKRRLVDRMVEELSRHAAVEEQLFYPVARATVPGTDDIVLESLEEHHVVKWVLSELDGMDPRDERFDAKVSVLIENVRHHVKEEENEFFPKVRDELGRGALADLGDAMATARRAAPTHPHPRSPDTPPGNLVVGAAAGVVDRLGDTVSGLAQGSVTAASDLVALVLRRKKPSVSPAGSRTARRTAAGVRSRAASATESAVEAAREAKRTGKATTKRVRAGARKTRTTARRTARSAAGGAKRTGRTARSGAKGVTTSARKSMKRTTTTAKRASTRTARAAKTAARDTRTTAKRARRSGSTSAGRSTARSAGRGATKATRAARAGGKRAATSARTSARRTTTTARRASTTTGRTARSAARKSARAGTPRKQAQRRRRG